MARKLAKKQPTTFRFEELEQRILFSADIAPGLDTAAVDEQVLAEEQNADDRTDTTDAAEAVDQNNEETRRELVFVNENVADYEQLLADLQRGDDNRVIEVVGLESDRDGIEQVSDILSERTDLSAVHFITHGADGQLNLGRSWLNSASLQQNSDAVSAWGNALNETGDILLYGCNIAANGDDQNLADTLADLTGADVVASDDITGHEDLGGDWNLEYASGTIETSVAVSGAAQAEYEAVLTTFIVDNTNDSGAGSLRQAILDANANDNGGVTDLITFNIGADGSQQTINLLSPLDPISESVIIDGFSQYGALTPTNPLIEINGAGTINDGLSFASTSDGSVVQGLMITGFSQFGIQIDSGADGISILGNWIGTTGTGYSGIGNDTGINIQGANTIIGGPGANDGNVITNNNNEGINITGVNATGTIILGNIIGLNPDGSAGTGNDDVGIALLAGADNTTIGGTTVEARNIISNNFEGIEINSDNNVVQGNYIGTDITGVLDHGNRSDDGIEIQNGATGNLIGGSVAGAGNLIAFNLRDGVNLASGNNNSVLGNSIHSNGDLGVDLGLSANDTQSAPVLSSVTTNGATISVNGSLNSTPGTTFRIEFFASITADGSGFGEAERYLGFVNVTTDASDADNPGLATFSTDIAATVADGEFITATATVINNPAQVGIDDSLAFGNSSEFGPNQTAVAGAVAPVNTVPAAQSTDEDVALTFNTANGNPVSITAGAGEVLTTTISVTQGSLNLSQTTGLTFDAGANGTATMTVTGTVEDINAALNGLQYMSSTDYNGADTLTLTSSNAESYSLEIDSNLLGRYEFSAASPGDDSSPVGSNTATLVGNATIVTDGTRGEVVSMDGTAHAEIPGFFGEPVNATLAAWVNITAYDSNGTDIISLGDNLILRYEDWNHSLNGIYNDGTSWHQVNFLTGINLAGDGWHHVAYSVDDTNNTHAIYFDGVEVASSAMTGSVAYPLGTNSYIGAHGELSPEWDLIGRIDDARIYDRALTATEIATLANASVQSSDSDSVAITVTPVNDAPTSVQTINTAAGGLTINADGGNDTYLLADSGLGAPLSRFTVEVQFEGGSDSTEVPFISYNTGSGDILAINTISDNTLELDIGTGSAAFSSAVNYNAALMDGQRHTLSVSWDNTAGDWSVYIDGALVDSGTGLSAGNMIPAGGTLMFGLEQDSVGGNFESQEFFNGTLHDIRLFDDVRTAVEIDANKDATLAPTTANLIANWQFDNLSTDGVITESVGGNNLTVQHTNQAGFTSSDPALSLVVDENAVNSTVVGQVKAIDVEAGDTHSYTITAGNTDGAFAIDANGTITVANSSALDYDTNPVFTLTIQATDDGVGNLSGSSTVTISLNEVNQAPIAIGESYIAVEGVPYSSELGLNDLLLNDSDPDGDPLTVNTTPVSGPANGELILNADGTFTYTPNDNFNGTDSFVYEILDGNGGIAQATATITVQQREIRILFTTQSDVNSSKVPGIVSWDAGDVLGIGDPNLSFEPVGSDGSILPFFDLEGFADSTNMTINGLHFVSNDLTVGSDNSIDLKRGDILFVSASDDVMRSTNNLAITAGDVIVFRPDVADDYIAGTFIHLLDQPGTNITTGITLIETDVLIGDITLQEGSLLFTQESVDEESSIYHYSAADVGAGTTDGVVSTLISSVDIGVNWNNFVGVMVVNEDLYLDGTMVPAGSIVTTLASGDDTVGNNGLFADEDNIIYLTVTSTTMGSGTTAADATLLFDAGDVGLNNNQKKIRSFSIIEEISAIVNVDPVITLSAGTISYTEGDPWTLIDPAAVLVDPDSADFDGGLLSVDFGTTGFPTDQLAIRDEGTLAGQIGASGNVVTYGGTDIGTYSGGSNGSEPLTVIFNVNADVTAIQALLRNITFINTSNNPTEAQRSVNFTITDGDGGVSNTETRSIVVNNINFAPVLTGANDLTAIDEDLFNSGGTLVSILISGWVTDADLGSVEGIAVTNVDNTNGSWEFSIDGGTSWTAFGSPDSNNARHIAADPDSFIRFVPNPDWNGTVTNGITFHAWDQTSGVNGDIIDLTNSNNLRDQFDTVSFSNNDGSAVWTSDWTEDNDDDSAATGNIRIEGGKLRLDNLDGGDKESIVRSFDLSGAASAVLTFDYDGFGEGGLDVVEFEVSNDGGSTWQSLESVDVVGNVTGSKSYNLENYTLLTADMQLRFSIVKGMDATTQHINFDNVDIAYSGTGVGGSTSVSVASASSSITVNPLNDAPIANDDPGNYSAELLSLNPLSYWRLGDVSGSAADIGSSANNGSYNGGTLGQTGAIAGDSDTALHFDAANTDYVSIPHSADYLLDDGTVQLWFNAETAANGSLQHLFSKDSMGYDTGGHLSLYIDASGHLEVRLQSTTNDYFVTSPVAVTEGEWHHAAISFGTEGMVLYLDGQVVDTNTYTGGLGTTSGGTGNYEPIAVGGGTQISDNLLVTPVNEFFTGLIDEVAILDGQLSAGTISALYDAGQECYAVDEESTLTVSSAQGVLINDFDADNDPLTVIEVNGSSLNVGSPVSLASGALVTLNADGSMFYDPNGQFEYLAQDQITTDTFTYVANDGTIDSGPATVTICITGVNDAPTVAAVNLGSINEDGSRLITQAELLTGSSDDDSDDSLSATNLALTSGSGTLTDHLDGTWTFAPTANWSGAVGFSFEVTDGTVPVANTASLTVNPVNDNPTVESTIADQSLSEDFASYTIDLNAAFADVETADVDLVYGVSGNTNINVSIAGGIATITTTADWHGNETLTFTATDAGGLSISQDVAFAVAAVADINDDTAVAVVEDTPTIIAVLTNDTFEGTPVVTATSVPVNGGSVTINADNTITYTPALNYNGPDSFTYTVTSGGVTETATVTVTVSPVNDNPTVESTIADQSLSEDFASYTIDLNAAFADVETADVDLVYGVSGNTNINVSIAGGIATITTTADWHGNETLTFTATDAGGLSISQDVAFAVAAVADINDDTAVAVVEDTPTIIAVLTNDTFEGTPVVTATSVPVNGGSVTINADNTITYTPALNYNGPDSFTYTVTSGGVTETATVTVTVSPVNDNPTVESTIADQSLSEDFASYTIDLNAAFDDVETADVDLVYGVSGNTNINVSIAGGIATITTTADWHGNETLTFTATDAGGLSISQDVAFAVAAVADITDDTAVAVVEDTPTIIAVLTNDTFEGTPVVTATSVPVNGGSVTINADNTITYTPALNYNGPDSFTYTVTSGGVTETATVTVTVSPVNDNPTVESTIADQSLSEDFASYTIDLNAAFDDVETADVDLVYGVSGNTNINVSIAGGIATITTTADWHGNETLTFTATDAGGLSISQDVAFAVAAVADINDDTAVAVVEDTPTIIAVLTNDTFEGTPVVTATSVPVNGGSVTINADNTITYTPALNYNGPDSFTYTVTSGGVTETATVTVTVSPVNDNPTVESTIADQSLSEDFASYTIDLNAAFDDVETADVDLVYGVSGNTNINVSIAGGIATITTTADWHGNETLTFTATDAGGLSISQDVAFAVAAVADITDDTAVAVVEDTPTIIAVLTNDTFEGTPVVTATSVPVNGGSVTINADNTITYTPALNYNGPDSFTYTVTSGGVTETATVTVTVSPVNDNPTVESTIADQSLSEDFASYTIDLNAAFDDVETADVDLVYGVSGNTNINVSIAGGIATITTTADWHGNETLTFTATDAGGLSISQDVAFAVAAVADITDDTAVAVVEDTPTIIAVLTNDTFEGTPVVTATSVPVNGGSVTINADNTITYTPALNYNGPDSFTYTVTSGGVTETATVTVTVSPVNDNPTVESTIADQSLSEDFASYTIDLNAAFDDVETADVDLVYGVSGNTNINVSIAGGIATITTTADWHGNETLTFTATDAGGLSISQDVAFAVAAVADINDDTAVAVVEDTPTIIAVLTNDTFEGTPVVTATSVPVNGGSVTINADNTITYTPALNYNGPDSFTYTVTSGGVTETATVTVTVSPVNDNPTVESTIADQSLSEDFASYTIDLNAAFDDVETADVDLVYGVSGNTNINVSIAGGIATITTTADWHGNETLTFTATDAGGLSISQDVAFAVAAVADINDDTAVAVVEDTPTIIAVLTNDTFEGTPVVTATSVPVNGGSVTINADNTITYTPALNYNGPDSFTYTVTSGGVTETATVTVTVSPVNDNPTVESTIADQSLSEDFASYTIDLNAAFDDVETADVDLVYGVSGNTNINVSIAGGIATITTTADWHGNETLTFTATDAGGLSISQDVAFAVAAVADINDDTAVAVVEDTPTIIAVLTNDTFEGTPVVTATSVPVNGGSVTINADNTITYTPALNYNGPDSFTYTVTSGGVTETATVTVTVSPVNDPTIITGGTSGSGDEDTTINGTLTATDNDGLTDGSVFAVTGAAANGSATIDAGTGAWSYTPNADYNGNDSFTVTITDDADNTTTQVISLSVAAIADIADDTDTTNEDTAVTTNVLTNDSFEGVPVITAITQGANGSVAIVDANAGTISYTPNANFNGTDSYTYTVTAGGVTETATVTVNVNPVDDPTIITGGTSGSGDEDNSITGTLTATDNDGLTDGSVFAVTGAAANGSATIDAGTGAWSYTPNADYNGNDSFTVTITDDADNTTTQVISLSVAAIADIADDTDTTNEDTAVTTNVLTNDSFEGVPVITAITQGANGSVAIVDANAGTISYTPNANFNGTDSYTYTVTAGGVTETATVTVNVNPVDDPTIITGGTSGSGDEDNSITGTLTATDNDGLTDGSVFAVTGAAANGSATIDAGTGAWSYTPNADYNGNDSFTVTITDDTDNTTTQVISLTINAVVDEENLPDNNGETPTDPEPDTDNDVPTDTSPDEDLSGNEVTEATLPPVKSYPTDNLPLMNDPGGSEPSNDILYLTDEDDTESEILRNRNDLIYYDNDLYKEISAAKHLNFNYQLPKLNDIPDDFSNIDFENDALKQMVENGDYDQFRKDIDEAFSAEQYSESMKANLITLTTTTFTIGFVSYLLRAGALLASLISTLPIWHGFDPIVIFARKKKKRDQNDVDESDESTVDTFFNGKPE